MRRILQLLYVPVSESGEPHLHNSESVLVSDLTLCAQSNKRFTHNDELLSSRQKRLQGSQNKAKVINPLNSKI